MDFTFGVYIQSADSSTPPPIFYNSKLKPFGPFPKWGRGGLFPSPINTKLLINRLWYWDHTEILTSYLAWTLLLGYIFNLQTPPPTLPPPLDYSLFLLYRLNMAIYGFGHMIPSWKLLDPFHIGRGGCADSKHILKLKTMPNTRSISLTVWSPHRILIHQLFGVYREREKPSNPPFGKGSRSF